MKTTELPEARPEQQGRLVAVIGAGTLGRRIALMFAGAGADVRLCDPSAQQRADALDFIAQEWERRTAASGVMTGKVNGVESLADAVAQAWLVIEAVPEKLPLKLEIFAQLDQLAPADAILASNSSSYPSSRFIAGLSEEGQRRVVNTHFYMPPDRTAVEVMSDGVTADWVIETLLRTLPLYGFTPYRVLRESVGFIYNRVWAAIKRECLSVVAEGVASIEDVDRLYMSNTGGRQGPFQQMDQVGLDVVLDIEEHYAAVNPALPTAPRELLRQYIAQGRLGKKVGRGFYDYPAGLPEKQ